MSIDWMAAVSNHLWQSSLFVVAAWGVTLLLRRQQAKFRYAVWLAASLKFLLPLSLLISLGASMHVASRTLPSVPQVEASVQQVAQPFLREEGAVGATAGRVPQESGKLQERIPVVLGLVWLTGSVVLVVVWSKEWLRLRGIVREAKEYGRIAEIPVRASSSLMEPGVFGVFRPVLLLPEQIRKDLNPAQMEAVMLHELQHVRRYDNLTAMLHMAVQAAFWFHPMMWWIKARLMEERELACDEAVLQSQTDAYSYAESILAVCRSYTETKLLCTAGISGASLKKRVAHIMSAPVAQQVGRGQRVLIAGLAVVVLAVPLAMGLMQVHAASTFAGMEESQAAAMASIPKMEFEVAAIKLNDLGVPPNGPSPESNVDLDPGEIYSETHGVFSARNKSLRTLIAFAYKMSGDQQNYLKNHVPAFVLNERFDVEARSENTHPTKDQMRAMVRSLLEDRFKLKVHNETIEADIYAMLQKSPGKFGPSMRIHPANDTACSSEESLKQSPMPLADGFPAICGVVVGMPPTEKPTETKHIMALGARNVPLSLVAAALVAPYTGDTGLRRSVVDKTGVQQNVDFVLQLAFDEFGPTFTPNTAPLFPTELSEQLGLKLKGEKGPINVYIVDHVEHLTKE